MAEGSIVMLYGKTNRLKVEEMTSTIAASFNEIEKIEQIRNHLKNCLDKSQQSQDPTEVIKYYLELSEAEGISLEDIVDRLISIGEKAEQIKILINKYREYEKFTDQALYLVDIYKVFSDLVKNDWDYLPPKAIDNLRDLQKDTEKSLSCLGLGLIDSISLLLRRSSNGENLLCVYRREFMHLVDAISEAMERDEEDALDLEVARAAKEEARAKGTVPWETIKARYRTKDK